MRIEQKVEMDVPRERIWKRVADPTTYPTFFKGVTRWEHTGGKKTGWRVYGQGTVTIYRDGVPTVYKANEPFNDDFVNAPGQRQ